mgnify:CR=1 FL=1
MTGWSLFVVPPAGEGFSPHLSWNMKSIARRASLRLAIGRIDRKDIVLLIETAKSETVIAKKLIRNPALFQPIDIKLTQEQCKQVIEEGIHIRQPAGEQKVFIIRKAVSEIGHAPALTPHLFIPLSEDDRLAQFLDRLASLDSLNEFNWRNGCILDGLWMLSRFSNEDRYSTATKTQLDIYYNYLDSPHGPTLDRLPGMENTLPWATLVRYKPEHHSIDPLLAHWEAHRRHDGAICDGDTLVAETNYTVAYPMAAIGRVRGDESLIDDALDQLRIHIRVLKSEGNLFLRCTLSGHLYFRNWCRGIAWYFLGMVRTLEESGRESGVDEIIDEIKRVAAWVSTYQRDDGLWHTFIDDPETPTDTSGSSGIASGIAAAIRCRWVDNKLAATSEAALSGLRDKLTLDGWLTGVAPGNVGGEAFQRHPYRATQQMGMGLMAGLVAELTIARPSR